jgi:hypothetical protein
VFEVLLFLLASLVAARSCPPGELTHDQLLSVIVHQLLLQLFLQLFLQLQLCF